MTDAYLPPRELWPEFVRTVPGVCYPDTLNVADTLLRHANERPDATAIVWRGRPTSYRALRQRVATIAAALDALGVRPGDRVAFRLPSSPEFIALWLAVQWVGAVGVPIPPAYRRGEIAQVVNHSGAVLVCCSEELAADVEAARPTFSAPVIVEITSSGAPECVGRTSAPRPFPTPSAAPALITYVSSASGALRGVVQSPATILAPADTYARSVLQLTAADVCAGSISMALAYGLGALLVFPLRVGGSVALLEAGTSLAATLAASRATVFFGVPTLYRLLLPQLELVDADLRRLRCAVSAAEPLPRDVASHWRARTGTELLNGLGTTELSHIVLSTRMGDRRPRGLGLPVPGYEARIVDAAFRQCADGVEGDLAVRGPTGALYWRDVEAQHAAVRSGWSLTGDVCVRHRDGTFEHIRRADDVIVSGGYKISPREVQRALEAHPAVRSARVFSVVDPVRGHTVAAEIAPAPGRAFDGLAEELQLYMKRELASFKCPRIVRVVYPDAVATYSPRPISPTGSYSTSTNPAS